MKICPTCNRTYADDALNFCLDDASTLSVFYDPHITQRFPHPRNTDQAPPRSSASEVTNKSEDVEKQTPADPFQPLNSIPVSAVHSKGGGTSIQHFERLDDGTQRLMYVADAFPRRPKINLFVLVVVSCIAAFLALIGAIVYWVSLRYKFQRHSVVLLLRA
jgi:hypothetical protein